MYSAWNLKLTFLKLCERDPVRNDSVPLGRGAKNCATAAVSVLVSPIARPPHCCYFRGISQAAAVSQPVPEVAVAGLWLHKLCPEQPAGISEGSMSPFLWCCRDPKTKAFLRRGLLRSPWKLPSFAVSCPLWSEVAPVCLSFTRSA